MRAFPAASGKRPLRTTNSSTTQVFEDDCFRMKALVRFSA